jgi:hypothetical protein
MSVITRLTLIQISMFLWKDREVLNEDLCHTNLLVVAKYKGRDLFEKREVLRNRSRVKLKDNTVKI